MNFIMTFILSVIPPIVLFTLLFIHAHYQKYSLFLFMDDFMQFHVMLFNKKLVNRANKGTIISYVALCSFIFSYLFYCYIGALLDEYDNIVGSIKVVLVFLLIVRLIYEFVVIPLTLYNQPTHMSYTQQGYSSQEAGNMPQQPHMPGSIDPAFKFCSQCGTKYNATDAHCPKCGMQ